MRKESSLPLVRELSCRYDSSQHQFEVNVFRHGPPLDEEECTLVKFTAPRHIPKSSGEILLGTARYYRKLEDGDSHETGFELPKGTRMSFRRDGRWHSFGDRQRVLLHLNNGWIYCVARWQRDTPITRLAREMERANQYATCVKSPATAFAEAIGVAVACEGSAESVDVIHGRVEYEEPQSRNSRLGQDWRRFGLTGGRLGDGVSEQEYVAWVVQMVFTKRLQFQPEREYRFLAAADTQKERLRVQLPAFEETRTHFGDVLCGKTGERIEHLPPGR